MSGDEDVHSKILQELREIIKLEYLIEAELDNVNAMVKTKGSFDTAVTQGIVSAECLGNMLKVSLNTEIVQKYQDMRSNLPTKAVDMDDELSN